MIINTVKIRSFKVIKKTEIELSPNANLLLGHNAQGKSAFLEAIKYCLTDSILGQQKKALPEIINNQASSASVAITGQAGDNPFTAKRTLSKTNRSGLSPIQVSTQLGIDPHILSACLDSAYYFDLDPADQKKLIIKALGLKPTLKDAYVALHEKGCASNVCEEFWNEKVIKEIAHLGWDAGYNTAYGLRREAGQGIKILEGEQPKLITQVAMGGKDIPVDAIMETHKKKPLAEQEKKHKVRLKELYEELGGIKALSAADKEEAEKQLSEYQTEKARIEEQPKWTGEDSAKAKQLKIAKKKFDTTAKEDTVALENLVEEAEGLLVKNQEEWKSNLACPIPGASGHKMCPAIEPDWSEQEKQIKGIKARILAVDEREFPEQDIWDALSEKASTCKDNIAHTEILNQDIKALEETLENAAPEAGEKKEALEISIAAIEEKVEHLKLAQSAITWNQATQETLDTTQVKIKEAETKREHYDTLCKILSPDGIPGELIAEKLGILNARLKQHSEMMGQEILFKDDLTLSQAKGKPLWILGGSEQARARMAIAEAISFVTGVKLLLLDELNISVSDNAAHVRKWLIKIANEGIQIIAGAATNAPEAPKVLKNDLMKVFWVENGIFREIGT